MHCTESGSSCGAQPRHSSRESDAVSARFNLAANKRMRIRSGYGQFRPKFNQLQRFSIEFVFVYERCLICFWQANWIRFSLLVSEFILLFSTTTTNFITFFVRGCIVHVTLLHVNTHIHHCPHCPHCPHHPTSIFASILHIH